MLCRLSALALVLCAMLAASAAGQGCPDALKSLSAWTAKSGFSFTASQGSNKYTFFSFLCQQSVATNECSTKAPTPYTDVMVCAVEGKGVTQECGGWPPKVAASDGNLVFTSSNGEPCSSGGANTAVMKIACESSLPANKISAASYYEYSSSNCQWTFFASSADVCPFVHGGGGGGGGGHGKKSKLSIGSILLIVSLCSLVLYCALGMAFQYKFRQARGKDIIPNRAFWAMIPGLIKDGVLFTYYKMRKQTYSPVDSGAPQGGYSASSASRPYSTV